MTAAPTRMPLFTNGAIDPHLQLASSYLSPASIIASESSFSRTSMPPHQEPTAQRQRKSKSPSAPTNDELTSDGGLIFIIGGTPADFKSKKNMTTVRKKAMDAYLRGDTKSGKDSRTSVDQARLNSDDSMSIQTRSSIRSHDAITDISTIPTTDSIRTENSSQTKTSSPTKSSNASSSHYQGSTSATSSIARLQKPRDFILPAAPIVLPSRKNVKLPYDDYSPPPFVSIGKSLDPFRTMFQSSHPQVSVEELKFHCSRYFGTRALGRYWIPTALNYPHTFLGTLCLATAYHDVIHEQPLESVQTIALRQEVIHLVGRNMLDPETRSSDHNIMAVIQLIISEVIGREESGLNWHENGIETMINQRGGLNQLGVHGYLASSIAWVSLASAVLREEQPRTMYADYCTANSRKHHLPTATIPESPIYCPRGTFKTIERSSRCTPKARELLGEIWMMIDIFLHETKQSRRNSQTLMNMYKRFISSAEYPSISELRKTNVLIQNDWKYEAIRIASIIQATAIIRRIPLSDALSQAATSHKPSTLNTASSAFRSSESVISPFDMRKDSSAADYATSPTYSTYSTSPTFQQAQSYFPVSRSSVTSISAPRSSISSINAPRASISSIATRPSITSTHTSSSEHIYFAPPPAPKPSDSTSLLKDLRTAIESSNISECWADMAGVLLWIGLVVGAASKTSENKLLRKYFSALTMRTGVMLCFDHPEAINATMLRMSEVIEALGTVQNSEVAAKDSDTVEKRRRI